MKKFLITLLMASYTLFGAAPQQNNYFMDNFLKYSTFYGSAGLQSPFTPKQTFAVDAEQGTFNETTEEIEGSYNLSLGIRKLARFKYQAKGKKFYDGSEKELSDIATIGTVSGWEYLIKFSSIRQFGEEFVDTESWVRYLGDNFVVKASYANFGREQLEFGQLDTRWRKALGNNWNVTVGGNFRAHPAYGLFPFNDWLQQNQGRWWELAYNYGYSDEFYWIDEDAGIGSYNWYDDEGNVVAEDDDEFYEYYYGDLITLYNEEEIDALGYQWEFSPVIGLDYYRYEKSWWVHSWVSIMPYSKGLTEYSFKHKKGAIDHDCGIVAGWKFNKNFGMFGEARYLSYWGINAYELKAGINFTVF